MVTVGVGVAWACSPQAYVNPLSTDTGREGAPLRVSGGSFLSGVPVEIRWNSPAGPLLGTAPGPNFSTTVTVPADATPGVYYVVALARNADGTIAGKGSASFEVQAPAGTAPGGTAPGGTAPGGTAPGAAVPGGAGPGTHGAPGAPSTTPGGAGGSSRTQVRRTEKARPPSVLVGGALERTRSAAPQVRRTEESRQRAVRVGGAHERTGSAGPESVARAATGRASSNPPIVRTSEGPVFGGSVASTAAGSVARRTRAEGSAWSTARGARRAGSGKDASILPDAGGPETSTSSSSPLLAIGAGLVGLGLMTLFAGFLVAETRRRRVPTYAKRR